MARFLVLCFEDINPLVEISRSYTLLSKSMIERMIPCRRSCGSILRFITTEKFGPRRSWIRIESDCAKCVAHRRQFQGVRSIEFGYFLSLHFRKNMIGARFVGVMSVHAQEGIELTFFIVKIERIVDFGDESISYLNGREPDLASPSSSSSSFLKSSLLCKTWTTTTCALDHLQPEQGRLLLVEHSMISRVCLVAEGVYCIVLMPCQLNRHLSVPLCRLWY